MASDSEDYGMMEESSFEEMDSSDDENVAVVAAATKKASKPAAAAKKQTAATAKSKPSKDVLSPSKNAGNVNGKKKTVEEKYQKKSQLEHILLRPDTYIGSIERLTAPMYVLQSNGSHKIAQKEITFTPGLYKIFDEIVVNAADNKQRDNNMDRMEISIDADANRITVKNNGEGIPIEYHKKEQMYVPTLIFGHLLTGSNFDDNEKKTTGGRNG